ncbi:MAG: class I SAM-dependent methyltransferase [Bacteroidetes bacterium]|nr:class I SAM-dependent methyltransferase [Bacteroidota bacterium]
MFKENDIRPENLLAEQERLFALDVERMMKHSDQFINSDCPVCDSTDHISVYSKYGMCFSKCNHCNTVFANPRPTLSIVEDYYVHSQNYKFWAENIFPLTEQVRREKIFLPRVNTIIEICKEHNINNGTLIEIGTGFGTFCVELQSRNFFNKIVPIEPTPHLAQLLRNKGFDVVEKFIEDDSINLKGDVVVAFEVLEHMLSPVKFLNKCSSLLNKGGIVYLTCPNGMGFDNLLLQEYAPAVDIEHLTLINPDSVKILFERTGFETLHVETPGLLDTDIVKNRLIKNNTLLNHHPLFRYMLVEKWNQYGEKFQTFLKENNMSGNMLAIGRKK